MDSAVTAALISAGVSGLISGGNIFLAHRRDARDHRPLQRASDAMERLLSAEHWELRSFDAIKHRIGDGFDDQTLRQTLLAAGALRFSDADGKEMWGLARRNEHRLDQG